MTTDKPHFIDRGQGLEPASTEEVAAVIVQHAAHDRIAYFPDCPECQAARARGDYPRWFPEEESK